MSEIASAPALQIRRAEPPDWPGIRALVSDAGLPEDGLDAALPSSVIAVAGAAPDAATVVGCAAIERYGRAGILRSVAVVQGRRGTGVGGAVVAAAEALAADLAIDDLFLLTETAAGWFPRLGYEPADRSDVPADVAASPEFAYACPVSAVLLRKRLAGP